MHPRPATPRRRLPSSLLMAGLLLSGCGHGSSGAPDPGAPAAHADTLDARDVQDTFVTADDGGTLHLRRYPADGPPVLLVHGLSSNHRAWDLDAERSLARHLQDRGVDAWLLDLRGHGLATHHADGRRQRAGWTMDTYGRHDLPAAIAHVQAVSGYDRVGYVGHSMGGMVAAIYLAHHGDEALSALAVVGAPVDFSDPEPLLDAALLGMPLAGLLPTVPTPALGEIVASLRHVPMGFDDILFSPGSISPEARAEMYRQIVSPLSRGEVRQFRQILAGERFVSRDGQTDYLDALSALDDRPLLVIAGRGDLVAPPDRVSPWIEAAASSDETLVIASRANGFSFDYGHLDLTVGDAAPAEIYSLIGDWLAPRLPPSAAAATPEQHGGAEQQHEQAG